MDLKQYLKGNILVMIDAANLESSVKDLGWWIDYRKLRNIFDSNRLVQIRDYSVQHFTKNQDQFFTFLKKRGFVLITKPLKVIKGTIRKANFDVEIAYDALEMIDSYDTLVLFSGDSDFDYLIRKLRAVGKRVLIISSRHHVSRELIQSCNQYIDLKKLRLSFERDNNKKSPSFATGG